MSSRTLPQHLSAIATGCATGVLSIDLRALKSNYAKLLEVAAPAEVGAVVKADAYGLGAGVVSNALHQAGCRHFFVATFAEARRLRAHLPPHGSIFVLNGLLPGQEFESSRMGIIPVLNSLKQVRSWAKMCVISRGPLPAVINVDTGMSSLGLSLAEIDELLAVPDLLRNIRLLYLMTQLVSADETNHVANRFQRYSFKAVARRFPRVPLSIADSGGIFLGRDFVGDLARPGTALYGGVPAYGRDCGLQAVVRLDVAVIQTRRIVAGMGVGQGWSYKAKGPMRLATVAAGYADGIPRSMAGSGALYFNGTRLPIVGRIAMDSTTVDVTSLPEKDDLKEGDYVEVIGPNQSLDDLARDAWTVPSEIMVRFGRRYRKIYLNGAPAHAQEACPEVPHVFSSTLAQTAADQRKLHETLADQAR